MAAAAGDAEQAGRDASWMLRLADDPWTRVHAAELYLEAGRPAEAAENAGLAIEDDPSLPEAWRVAGLAALALGDADGALDRLERARGLPGVEAARLGILVERGDPAGLAALHVWTPRVPEDGLALARLLARAGQREEAVARALDLALDPIVGAEALRLAVEAAAAGCDLEPVRAWTRDHPSVRVVWPEPDPAACGADTVPP